MIEKNDTVVMLTSEIHVTFPKHGDKVYSVST